MRKIVFLLFVCLFFISIGVRVVSAQGIALKTAGMSGSVDAPQSATVLCPPGRIMADIPDCALLGAAAYLERMAEKGLTIPPRPLPALRPDPALSVVNFYYARLKDNIDTPVYASVEDAAADATAVRYISGGPLRFISYIDTANPDGGDKPKYFQLRDGSWVSAASVSSRIGAVPRFQGLIFEATPPNTFGWIVPLNPTAETKSTPGYYPEDFTGHAFVEYDVVQVYDVQQVNDVEWVMVGPDEWLEGRLVGMVTPRIVPPEGIKGDRWIEINLDEQTLAAYDDAKMVFATMIASGLEPFWTRPGLFRIEEKLEETVMKGTFEADRSDFYYLEDVPWTMYFDDARALHAAYWRARFGFAQSHGCVNLSPGDAHWLFNWAQVGDSVYVWDPSGKTPTDPSLYTGGAP